MTLVCQLCGGRCLQPPWRGRFSWPRHAVCVRCGLVRAVQAVEPRVDEATRLKLTLPINARQTERAQQFAVMFDRHAPKARRVLDCGCGDGHIARALTDNGRIVDGVEPVDAFAAAAKDKGLLVWADATQAPDHHYDVILLGRTLSVCENPAALLRLLLKKLKAGGMFFVQESNLLLPNPKKRIDQWLGAEVNHVFAASHLVALFDREHLAVEVQEASSSIQLVAVPKTNPIQSTTGSLSMPTMLPQIAVAMIGHETTYYRHKITAKLSKKGWL